MSGNAADGADNVHSKVGNVSTSHKNSSFNSELKAFVSEISSSGGVNQAAIDKFKKTLEDLGIDFNYTDK